MKSVSDFSFYPVYGAVSVDVKLEVIKIWTQFGGLDQAEADRRVNELILFVRNKSGEIVGISTASKLKVKQLNDNWFYMFRYFIVPSFRFAGLDFKIVHEAVGHLETIFAKEPERLVGIRAIVQNKGLKELEASRRTVPRNVPFVFAGYLSNHPVRVYYFKDARI